MKDKFISVDYLTKQFQKCENNIFTKHEILKLIDKFYDQKELDDTRIKFEEKKKESKRSTK